MGLPTPTTLNTRVLIGHPGDKLILPKGVKITSIVKDADIDATSTCETVQQKLDAADSFGCFAIYWAAGDSDAGHTPAFGSDDANANIIGIGIGSREMLFAAPVNVFQGSDTRNVTSLQSAIDTLRDKPLINPIVSYEGHTADRFTYRLLYKAASTVGETIYLIFKVSDFSKTITYGTQCENCCGTQSAL